ncbi:T-cell surface protein tactile [Varanus komodoensis]|uniref:T-cell surface protein tactile n=1 Tax=Varanus komodoensis TaxID=61221 RepID=UPI001CF7CB1F|nr:T-cell surface protein tactile [Varanus komodoensis]
MAIRSLFLLHYFFILIGFISAQTGIIIKNEETIHAFPGDDVTLMCRILKGKKIHITQTQWSKVADGPSRRLAVYNPQYGTQYGEMDSGYSVSYRKGSHNCLEGFSRNAIHSVATENDNKCYEWILHLTNVSLEQSGFYKCIFTAFPTGPSSSKINLTIKKRVEDSKSFVVEALLNQTLEIPCFKDMPFVNGTLKWLLKQNGNEEMLKNEQPYHHRGSTPSVTIDRERIHLNSENSLIISPVSVLDDGKMFVCSAAHHTGRILKNTTEIKVFAKPEISIALITSVQGEGNFTCMVRKAFPKPNLLWFINGEILKDSSEGIFIVNEDAKLSGGFYEMRSLLTVQNATIHLAFKCMSVYPVPRSETQNISSEEIVLPYGEYQTTSLAFSEFITQATAISDSSEERLQTMTSETSASISQVPSVSDSSREKPRLSTKSLQDNTMAGLSNYSTVQQKLQASSTATPETSIRITHLYERTTPSHSNQSTKGVTKVTTLTVHDNSPTGMSSFNDTGLGTETNPKHIQFPWPAIVAALLFFCTLLIIMGVRKWCQYQKEIMNRPPSFKPPPPPAKYISVQDSDRILPSYSELESL